MSQNNDRMPYQTAKALAAEIVTKLAPLCEKIEIAGSIRRECPTIGDIEIVCQPNGTITGEKIAQLLTAQIVKNGQKYKQFILPNGVKLDLFLVTPPAQWGFILAQRTGPAKFSQQFFTQAHLAVKNISFQEACVFINGIAIETPTEESFFEAIGQRWIHPVDRLIPSVVDKTRNTTSFSILGINFTVQYQVTQN